MNISHVQEFLCGFAELSIQGSRKEEDGGGTHSLTALARSDVRHFCSRSIASNYV